MHPQKTMAIGCGMILMPVLVATSMIRNPSAAAVVPDPGVRALDKKSPQGGWISGPTAENGHLARPPRNEAPHTGTPFAAVIRGTPLLSDSAKPGRFSVPKGLSRQEPLRQPRMARAAGKPEPDLTTRELVAASPGASAILPPSGHGAAIDREPVPASSRPATPDPVADLSVAATLSRTLTDQEFRALDLHTQAAVAELGAPFNMPPIMDEAAPEANLPHRPNPHRSESDACLRATLGHNRFNQLSFLAAAKRHELATGAGQFR